MPQGSVHGSTRTRFFSTQSRLPRTVWDLKQIMSVQHRIWICKWRVKWSFEFILKKSNKTVLSWAMKRIRPNSKNSSVLASLITCAFHGLFLMAIGKCHFEPRSPFKKSFNKSFRFFLNVHWLRQRIVLVWCNEIPSSWCRARTHRILSAFQSTE